VVWPRSCGGDTGGTRQAVIFDKLVRRAYASENGGVHNRARLAVLRSSAGAAIQGRQNVPGGIALTVGYGLMALAAEQ
jgi:hypothetical protein